LHHFSYSKKFSFYLRLSKRHFQQKSPSLPVKVSGF